MTGYDANVDDLTSHARTVAGLADELRGALSAAGQAGMTDNAYGLAGQQVTSVFKTVAQAGQDTIQAAAGELDSVTTKLRANATAYAQQESTQSGTYNGIGRQLR